MAHPHIKMFNFNTQMFFGVTAFNTRFNCACLVYECHLKCHNKQPRHSSE